MPMTAVFDAWRPRAVVVLTWQRDVKEFDALTRDGVWSRASVAREFSYSAVAPA